MTAPYRTLRIVWEGYPRYLGALFEWARRSYGEDCRAYRITDGPTAGHVTVWAPETKGEA